MSTKPNSRLGKPSIFSRTTDPPENSEDTKPANTRKPKTLTVAPDTTPASSTPITTGKGPGRPRRLEAWTKATVVLRDSNIMFIDGLSLKIKGTSRAAISRAEIIRAMIEAIEDSGLDLTGATSEEHVKAIILDRLKR